MSNKLATIKVRIAGVSPLLMAAIPDGLEQRKPKVLKGEEGTPRETAARQLYVGSDGQTAIVPCDMLWKSIIQAGKFHKEGKRQLTTRDSSILPGSLTIVEQEFPLEPQEWEVHFRMVTNQATKGKVPSWRPRFDLPWAFNFTLQIDTGDFTIAKIREVVDDAGRRIGIGSFRPETKGPYGKFRVECWEPDSPVSLDSGA